MARACSTCAIGEVEKKVSQLPSLPHLQEFSCTTASFFHIFDWPSKPTSQGWSSDSQYKANNWRSKRLFIREGALTLTKYTYASLLCTFLLSSAHVESPVPLVRRTAPKPASSSISDEYSSSLTLRFHKESYTPFGSMEVTHAPQQEFMSD
ncbi:uncharacterized protein RAG0_09050 [Rhynchosporium agropyri]|uniref:Uncharacterized protein n=1 Tax=Rhynchosporium agropyri TaxID=914238 RepID=A0A1E1KTL0_9HELO|nr:uncharacterized protein RAG0_09050 [Rhynchosporium agropyri]